MEKKKILEKKQKSVSSIPAYVEALGDLLLDEGQESRYLFRGLSDSSWELKSTAERRLEKIRQHCDKHHKKSSVKDFSDSTQLYNQGLIDYFKHEILRQDAGGVLQTDLGVLQTDLGILAQLRHYNAANSLIDFTANPLVALWFACQEENTLDKEDKTQKNKTQSCDGVVYIINTKYRDVFVDIYKEEQLQKVSIYDIYEKYPEKWLCWKPADLNKRIPAQSSYLLIGARTLPPKTLTKLIIPRSKKKGMLKTLEGLYNINARVLFPGMSGFAMINSANKPYSVEEHLQSSIRSLESEVFAEKNEGSPKRKKIRDLNKRLALTYNNRGEARLRSEKYTEAEDDFSNAIELDPKYTKAKQNRKQARAKLRGQSKAL